jgi:hypothetical protein
MEVDVFWILLKPSSKGCQGFFGLILLFEEGCQDEIKIRISGFRSDGVFHDPNGIFHLILFF